MNPYLILGVEKEATADDIKKAWRKMCKMFHPDAGTSKDTIGEQACKEKMENINEAYRILSDPELREQFDRDGEIKKELPDKIAKKEIFAQIVTEIFRNEEVTGTMLHTILPRRIRDVLQEITNHKEKEEVRLEKLEQIKSEYAEKEGEAILVMIASLNGVIREQKGKIKQLEDHIRRHELVKDMIEEDFDEPEEKVRPVSFDSFSDGLFINPKKFKIFTGTA